MKTTHFVLSLISFIIIGIVSCQKGFELEPVQPTQNSLLPDSSYLRKIIYLDTSSATIDTSEVICFYYDSLRRVTRMTTGNNSTTNFFSDITYSYNLNDTIPFKSLEKTLFDTILTYHFYDLQKRKTKDSSIGDQSAPIPYIVVNKYSYYPNGVAINIFDNENMTTLNLDNSFKDSLTLDSRGNITLYKEYAFDFSITNFELRTIVTTTFDNKPNPLAKLSNYAARDIAMHGESFITDDYPQKNNPTRFLIQLVGSSVPTFDNRNDYTYTTDDIIKRAKWYSVPNNAPYGKTIYIYQTL